MKGSEKFSFFFPGVFCWCWHNFGGDWVLGYNSMKFWDYSDLSWFPKILSLLSVRQFVMQLVYLIFITNNHALFLSLWVKRKFGETSKILKILWPCSEKKNHKIQTNIPWKKLVTQSFAPHWSLHRRCFSENLAKIETIGICSFFVVKIVFFSRQPQCAYDFLNFSLLLCL